MADSPVAFHVKCSDAETHKRRSARCAEVQLSLESQLPASSPTVLCLIDDVDFYWLKRKYGETNRGHFAAPIRDKGLREVIPPYFYDLVAPMDSHTYELNYLFDSVIYLHGTTCEKDMGLVLTLAHELCHFLQYANARSTWAANQLLAKLGAPAITVWWDVPVEREARQVAKRVAQDLFDEPAVQDYIEAQVRETKSEEDREDWRFVLNLPTAPPYSPVEPTKLLVAKHKSQLEAIRARDFMNHPDVSRLNLDTVEITPYA
jgi:hypothetical protein